jgi:hypothetical protein
MSQGHVNPIINNRNQKPFEDSIKQMMEMVTALTANTPPDIFISDGSSIGISTTDARVITGGAGYHPSGGTPLVTGIGDSTILDGLRKLQESNIWLDQNGFIPAPQTSNPKTTEVLIQLTMDQLADQILSGDFSKVSSKNLLAMLVIQKRFQEAIDKAKEHLGLDF